MVIRAPRGLIADSDDCGQANRLNAARKAYLRSVISYVEVDDDRVRIVGEKATLAAVVAGQTHTNKVRGFVRKWRASQNKTANTYVIEISI
jgi:hypothetical protein